MSQATERRLDAPTPWGAGASTPFRFGFLLVPNFTLIGLGSAIDPLRIVNMVAKRSVYEYVTIGETGNAVLASDGVHVLPNFSIANAPKLNAVLVVGPNPIPQSDLEPILRWLKRCDREGAALGGVDTGTYFLARAGLLDGYRCTIHWEDMGELVESFPRLLVSRNLFEVDRNRCSCSGGVAAVDMMIHLIRQAPGGRMLAMAVSELLICQHRGPEESQPVPLKNLIGAGRPKLIEAVTLMEANIEEPLSMVELASHVGLSSRQLERLFSVNLGCKPSQYYLRLRLDRARQLLKRTDRSVSEIAVACGFVSLAHFTTRYGTTFGVSPRLARLQDAQSGTSTT
jgi:AraC family transcriptional regulator, glycine betaine-responsive activator